MCVYNLSVVWPKLRHAAQAFLVGDGSNEVNGDKGYILFGRTVVCKPRGGVGRASEPCTEQVTVRRFCRFCVAPDQVAKHFASRVCHSQASFEDTSCS